MCTSFTSHEIDIGINWYYQDLFPLVRFSKLVSKEMLLRRLFLTWYENNIIRVKRTLILVNRLLSLNLWLNDSFSIHLPLFLLLPKVKPLS